MFQFKFILFDLYIVFLLKEWQQNKLKNILVVYGADQRSLYERKKWELLFIAYAIMLEMGFFVVG